MTGAVRSDASRLARLRFWLLLTGSERLWLAAILAIFLIGVAARWWHLARERPDPYVPEGMEEPR